MKKRKAEHIGLNQDGFTLIEVIVALAIVTIGILAVNSMQIVSVRGNYTASNLTTASTWAADQMEQIYGWDFDDTRLAAGADGDRDIQDTNDNGIDDDDEVPGSRDSIENFGLDQDTVATADGNTTSNDVQQKYTILWNVADNIPMPDTKTIHVIVTWNDRGMPKSLTLRHKKAKYF